ncbi:MAG: hypothetical protein IKF82_00940 [Bacilli bacterium]|nr:hypothetical protein [Bacilli bacterium]
MTKELKIELFNIYDVVVFEDEKGITQDCVCSIGKDKEVDEIECNNHDISIYENGSYKVWEKNGKNLPYYATNKKIIHLYTLKNDNRFYEVYPTSDYEDINDSNFNYVLECLKVLEGCADAIGDYSHRVEPIKQALQRLESIDNANPSEALECLKLLGDFEWHNKLFKEAFPDLFNTIEQYILKTQEQEKEKAEYKKMLKIIKEKCLYDDNLFYVAVCINYDMYKNKMNKKYDKIIEKTTWNDKSLLDYLKLLTEEEFDTLKRWL